MADKSDLPHSSDVMSDAYDLSAAASLVVPLLVAISIVVGLLAGDAGLAAVCCTFGIAASLPKGLPQTSREEQLVRQNQPETLAPSLKTSRTAAPVESAVARLRDMLEEPCPLPMARRFLNGAKGDIVKGARLCSACLRWRAIECIDDILNEAPVPATIEASLRSIYDPRILEGLDYQDRPVMYCHFGKLDLRAFAKGGFTPEVMIRRHIREMERLARLLDSPSGRNDSSTCTGHLLILDVFGLSLTRVLSLWKVWSALAKVSNEYYPELLGTCCIVRGPRGAKRILDMCKAKLLDPVTQRKIVMAGQDPLPTLRTLIPSDVLRQLPTDLLGQYHAHV